MNCKECKDTRVYQPLIGPPEPCQACCVNQLRADTNISSPTSYSFIARAINNQHSIKEKL